MFIGEQHKIFQQVCYYRKVAWTSCVISSVCYKSQCYAQNKLPTAILMLSWSFVEPFSVCIVRKEVYLPFAWKEIIFSFSFSNTYPTELSHFYLFSYLTATVYYCSSKNCSVVPAGRVFLYIYNTNLSSVLVEWAKTLDHVWIKAIGDVMLHSRRKSVTFKTILNLWDKNMCFWWFYICRFM